jgi:glucose-1-phosphate thymidylyltransferase
LKSLILAGGTGSRLWPVTRAVSKQLVPVYDKPMIYYPLSTAMLSGAMEIALVTTPESHSAFQNLLGDGSHLGLSISYLEQAIPKGLADAYIVAEEFLDNQASLMVLGDNLFHGAGFGNQLRNTATQLGATVFGYQVSNPQDYGVVSFDSAGSVETIVEKPKASISNVAIPGLYFMDQTASERAKSLKPSSRGELEITDLLKSYLRDDQLKVTLLPRSTVWLDTGNAEAMAEATEYVRVIQKRQNQMVGCPEEIAWRLGLISTADLELAGKSLEKSPYGQYLLRLSGGSNV